MTADSVEPNAEGRPELAVGAVVVVDNHLLLVQRRKPPAVGLWTVPGGRVERGELLHHAVEREVMEETGLTVKCGSLVGWVERVGRNHHFVILDFWATVAADAPARQSGLPPLAAADDAADARWVSLRELATVPLVAGLLDFLVDHGVVTAV